MKFGVLIILSLFLATPGIGLPVYRESEIFDPSSGEATRIDFSVLHLDLVGTDDFFGSGHPKNEPGLERNLSGMIEQGSGALLKLTLEFDVPVTNAESVDDPNLSRGVLSWSPEDGLVTMDAFDFEYVGSLRIAFEQRPTAVVINALLIDYAPGWMTQSFGIDWRLRTPGRAVAPPALVPVPEPSAAFLVAAGLLGIGIRSRRTH